MHRVEAKEEKARLLLSRLPALMQRDIDVNIQREEDSYDDLSVGQAFSVGFVLQMEGVIA